MEQLQVSWNVVAKVQTLRVLRSLRDWSGILSFYFLRLFTQLWVAVLASMILAIITITFSYYRYTKKEIKIFPKQLEVVFATTIICLGAAMFIVHIGSSIFLFIINLMLTITVVLSILLKRPFTLDYSREVVVDSLWSHPKFVQLNYQISYVWGIVFLTNTLLYIVPFAYKHENDDDESISDQDIVVLHDYIAPSLIGMAIIFSAAFPRVVRYSYLNRANLLINRHQASSNSISLDRNAAKLAGLGSISGEEDLSISNLASAPKRKDPSSRDLEANLRRPLSTNLSKPKDTVRTDDMNEPLLK